MLSTSCIIGGITCNDGHDTFHVSSSSPLCCPALVAAIIVTQQVTVSFSGTLLVIGGLGALSTGVFLQSGTSLDCLAVLREQLIVVSCSMFVLIARDAFMSSESILL